MTYIHTTYKQHTSIIVCMSKMYDNVVLYVCMYVFIRIPHIMLVSQTEVPSLLEAIVLMKSRGRGLVTSPSGCRGTGY
jgi:hypothetical protein